MKVAIVGAGIAGLAAARALAPRHEVTVFEAAARAGGHAHTVDVDGPDGPLAIDLGFIVSSRARYPRFYAMLDELGVATRPTTMSFAVRAGDLAWGSAPAAALRAPPRFLVALGRFLAQARRDVGSALARATTIDEYCAARRVPEDVRDGFVRPIAAALWSLGAPTTGAFPAETWLAFLDHHGMLRPVGGLTWRTIVGGSRRYVDALLARLRATVRLAAPVARVARDGAGVTVVAGGAEHRADRAILACAAPVALALLDAPTDDERRVLGAVRFADNRVVLHGDARFLGRPAASWNVADGRITYWMNRLQGLPRDVPYLVTLDPRGDAAPRDVLVDTTMAHPQLDRAALAAQAALPAIQGPRVFYAGAWTGFGFHEDGMRAGEDAAARAEAS